MYIIDKKGQKNAFMEILLHEYLKKHHISYRKAAILTGISKSTLFDISSGKIDPKMGSMEKIAKGLNTKISNLYDSPYK